MLKLSNFMESFLKETKDQIITEGDYVEFTPIRGRKRVFKLNRAKVEIVLKADILEVQKEDSVIYVPAIKGEEAKICLKLYENDLVNSYYLESNSGDHFILNSRICKLSFLRNGDSTSLVLI